MDLKVGDVLLRADEGFLPKGIQFFMAIYRKKKGLPPAKLYNHAMVIVNLWGTLWMAESAENGVVVHQDIQKYMDNPNVLHLTWKEPLSEEEQETFSKTAIRYCLRNTRYDFINFIDQIRFVLTGKWKGKTGEDSQKRVYCSEFAAVCMDETRGSFNGVTWSANPLDVELNKDLIPVTP